MNIGYIVRIGERIIFFVFILLTIFTVLVHSVAFEHLIFSVVPTLAPGTTIERQQVSTAIRQFLFDSRSLPLDLFTDRERAHMSDVKILLSREFFVWFFIAFVFVLTVSARRLRGSVARPRLRGDFWWSVGVIVLLLTFSYLFFDEIFISFHELSFNNDLWLLDPETSALIRSYPPDFFKLFFLVNVVLASIIFIGIELVGQRKKVLNDPHN